MTQKLLNKECETYWQAVIRLMLLSNEQYLNQCIADPYNTEVVGKALYDSEALSIFKRIPEDVFLRTFKAIVEVYRYNGSFYAWRDLLVGVFGADVKVVFDVSKPCVLRIGITAKSVSYSGLVSDTNIGLVTDENIGIAAAQLYAQMSYSELQLLLQALVPVHVFVDFTLDVDP